MTLNTDDAIDMGTDYNTIKDVLQYIKVPIIYYMGSIIEGGLRRWYIQPLYKEDINKLKEVLNIDIL